MTEGRAFPIQTDLATVAVFDSQVLQHRSRQKGDWWRQGPLVELEELQDGRAALLPIGKEGRYRLELRRGELSELQRGLVVGTVRGLGVEVRSGELFVGIAERLPGDGRGGSLSGIPGTGELYQVEPGRYPLEVHVLDWRKEDAYFDEDAEPLPDAPADFVVVLGAALAEGDMPPALDELPELLDLIPQAEIKGRARVPQGVRRRPSAPEPGPRQRRARGERQDDEPERLEPSPPPEPLRETVSDAVAPLTPTRARTTCEEVLDQALRHPPARLGAQQIRMRPRDRSLLSHDLDVDELLRKFTRVRENMRVLEQKLNAEERLDLYEQVELHTPLTRVYQSLDELLDWLARHTPRA